jgi:hypothetical protein
MNAENELLNAYREWHRLARAESKAIRTRNWDLLADCQLAIKDFQTLIGRLTLDARREWEAAGGKWDEREKHISIFVNELIELTRQNQADLQTAKNEAAARLGHLQDANRNLKMLQRSYGAATLA